MVVAVLPSPLNTHLLSYALNQLVGLVGPPFELIR